MTKTILRTIPCRVCAHRISAVATPPLSATPMLTLACVSWPSMMNGSFNASRIRAAAGWPVGGARVGGWRVTSLPLPPGRWVDLLTDRRVQPDDRGVVEVAHLLALLSLPEMGPRRLAALLAHADEPPDAPVVTGGTSRCIFHQAADLVPGADQACSDGTTDKTRSAGDEYIHRKLLREKVMPRVSGRHSDSGLLRFSP